MSLLDSILNFFTSSGGSSPIDVARRFDLSNRTGQGSMSKVWRAYDKKLGRTICLKLLDKEKTIKYEARFVGMKKPSEGEICMNLKHLNIVQTFEYGKTKDGEPYLIMELIEGHGFNYLIETRSKDLDGKRIDLLGQFADGLEYLHKAGYLHRDVCPRNAMVSNEGVLKIIDFGLTIPYTAPFCKPGNRTGTTNYLAPELIQRRPTDHRVDLFALGVTAYEAFTYGMPWERGPSEKLLRAMVNVPPRDPREIRSDLDEPTAKFLLKAVDRDPKLRFQTAAAFRDAIRELPNPW